jgi:hypothetical protein
MRLPKIISHATVIAAIVLMLVAPAQPMDFKTTATTITATDSIVAEAKADVQNLP